jgi:hypothetical protein
MLDADGALPYQSMDKQLQSKVDITRATDEIALVNRETGQVTYGVGSLMAILQHSFPWLRPVFRLRWFRWAAEKAYRFVSYNRRVIVPACDPFANQPSFNMSYRLLYLAFTWVVTASLLHRYSQLLVPLIPPASYGCEFLICGGQIFWQLGFLTLSEKGKAWQLGFLTLSEKGKAWDYLGNMMTISFAGGLLLGLIQLLSLVIQSP